MKINWPWSRKDSLSTSDLYRELLFQASSKSGIPVNWKTALQASTAFGCARVIAEGIAQVPFKLFKERVGGGMDPAKDHHLYELLYLKPNEWQTSFELREQIGLHLAFKGNAYVYKVRGLRNKIVELLAFDPNSVEVKRDKDWGRKYLVRTFDGRQIEVASEDMWHLRGISWDGVVGLEGVKLAKEVIGLALAMEEHSARMFSNGAKPGGILSTDANLKEDQIKILRESWNQTNGGNSNAYNTAIMFGGLKWTPLAMTGVDSQHLEQRRFEVENTCRFFRVMPIMVMQADKAATYASSENMFIAHVVHTLMPWYTRIEQSADVNLLTAEERKQGYYSKFMAQALLRGASKDRSEYFAKALGSGGSPAWMTQDEVRAMEEMNPMGDSAATLREPSNVGQKPTQGASDATPA
ncbi:MAG: phage portal protein [Gallionellales bacterium 35-53-114]|jgi:HK97 family phage portal protein|nr:MAG: phage portal protein [Gallionellales bacterium 35-53-114]OYZ65089.1 MAG: phage portal protein [Gallionellales bacterium 24-53-125]OZB07998.1 MAG: phage portal protein [Gallionellales bacterium 39-52-133]HQS59739.1 phage portal protein [Gallionellaceae bacterium]HQS76493.1 phage portal protein [Gallionellaceae bacterium]